MLQALTGYVKESSNGEHVLESINYRNLAPLYCDEPMRICCLKKSSSSDGNMYDVWIEGPTGGVAVKGTVRTTAKPLEKSTGGRHKSPGGTDVKHTGTVVRFTSHSASHPPSNLQPRNSNKQTFKRIDSSPASTPNFEPEQRKTLVRAKLSQPAKLPVPLENHASSSSLPTAISSAQSAKPKSSRRNRTKKLDGTNIPQLTVPHVFLEDPINSTSPLIEYTEARTTEPSMVPKTTATSISKASYTETEPVVPRVGTPSSHMAQKTSYRTRFFIRRSAQRTTANFSVTSLTAIPLVRTYRGRRYVRNASRVASKHSRFKREGVKKVDVVRVRISDRFDRGRLVDSRGEKESGQHSLA